MRVATRSCLTLILGVGFGFVMPLLVAIASESPSQVSPTRTESTSPVRLPPAQEAKCRQLAVGSRGPLHEQCLRVGKILAIMSVEPRETAWADAMESSLHKWIESLEPDGFTFRNAECRLSWCVVEVGSTVGAGDTRGHDIILESAEARKYKIFQAENMFARDPDGANVWDVLVFFKRYCTSTSEILDNDARLVPNFYTVGQTC